MSDIHKNHVALLPSAGMGHLAPFLRLAAALDAQGCTVTVVTTNTTVSSAESRRLSRFFSAHPRIRVSELHLLPLDPATAASADPFFLQFEAIRRSIHTIGPLLTSLTPPLSSFVVDISITSAVVPCIGDLPFPTHILFTSSTAMFAFCAYFPFASTAGSQINIPGLPPVPISSVPPLLLDPKDNLFKTQFVQNGLALNKVTGSVLINSFASLEPNTFTVLNGGCFAARLPPSVAVGPLMPCSSERDLGSPLTWLDAQPEGSVAYVSFGSRTAIGPDQIKQLAIGLERSDFRFLWVVKSKVVDREEEEEGTLVCGGDELMERVGERGWVMRGWVDQWEVLGHSAVGGFVSHCGWNSVTEAALQGVPILAWPQSGDQKINAEVVESSGLGTWERRWGWGGTNGKELVMGDEIADRVRQLMTDSGLKAQASRVREEARRAIAAGGSSTRSLIDTLNSQTPRSYQRV